MKPYYSDDWCTIYNCDCREVLPELMYDVCIADPPYGIDYQSAWRNSWDRKDKITGDKKFPLWLFDILRPASALFVWCRWDNLYQLPKPKSFIVWNKGNHSMGNLNHEFGRQWEACAFYPKEKHSFLYRPSDIIEAARVPPNKMVHPNEKPVGTAKPLIASHAGLILDPFVDSGTTLRAAKDLNRKSIGIEISEKYCEVAANRMSQEVLDLR